MTRLRFLLDQMLDEDVAQSLRSPGYDVIRVSELGLATADDADILEHSIRGDRLLLTLDEHFGDWTVLPLSHHPGVVRIKANPATTTNILAVLLPFLERSSDRNFQDQLIIVRTSGVRWVSTAS